MPVTAADIKALATAGSDIKRPIEGNLMRPSGPGIKLSALFSARYSAKFESDELAKQAISLLRMQIEAHNKAVCLHAARNAVTEI